MGTGGGHGAWGDAGAMQIRVLGRLTVTDADGVRLPADGLPRRARQLLGVLTARHDRIQSKDALADAVWGDELPRNHVAALEHYISVVRRRLQPGLGAAESFIVTRSGGYVLDTSRVGLDLADLRRTVRAIDAAPPAGPERLRLHQEVLDLAEELPFPEDEYADWAGAARTDVRLAVLAAQLFVSAAVVTEDPGRALRLAQEAITLDQYLEQSYRAAMTASVALGRPDDALRWYERCRQVLDDDLGVAPSAETTQLHRAVLAARRSGSTGPPPMAAGSTPPAADPPAPATDRTPAAARPTTPAVGPRPTAAGSAPGSRAAGPATESHRTPGGVVGFVGRRMELDLLLDSSPVPVVHLVGPPGSGKSALLLELRRRAPGRVGIGHGPIGAARPDGASVLRLTWLRSALTEIGAGIEALAVVDAAMTQQRPMTIEELELLATAVDRPEPVVLAVDDASELDGSSVAELAWLGRRCASLSVVLAYRYPSEIAGRPIATLGSPVVLRLAPLAAAEVDELGEPDLTERTGGIPALVAAAHRPPEVTAAVAMQIARSRTHWMPEDGWEVLRLSAALGPLRVADLAALTGRPLTEVLTRVDQLIHAHLLTEEPDGYVRHRSALIRAAVAGQVSAASGTHLRARLAAVED